MKHILLTCFSALHIISVVAQMQSVDSIRIKMLNQNLSNVKGTAEVDLLNDIAWEYTWAGKDKTPAKNYAALAKEKAIQIKYERGLGYAYLTLSSITMDSDSTLSDSLCFAALSIAEKIKDSRLLGLCYYRRWDLIKAIGYFRQAGDLEGEAETATWLCSTFRNDPQFKDEGFNYCQRAVELAQRKWTHNISYGAWISQFAYENMALLYQRVGDYQSALEVLQRTKSLEPSAVVNVDHALAEVYAKKGARDSALFYIERFSEAHPKNARNLGAVAEVYLQVNEHRKAIPLFQESIKKFGTQYEMQATHWYIGLGQAYIALNDYNNAIKYTTKGYQLAQMSNKKEHIKNASRLLSEIHAEKGNHKSAYQYLKEHMQLKDSLENNNFLWRLNMQLNNHKKLGEDAKRLGELNLLNKDNQLKKALLRQEKSVKNSLVTGIILLLLIGLITFRTLHLKRKNEKLRSLQLENELQVPELLSKQKQAELHQRATELEMQALRAQMNPHFIFNCLSSINRFVLKNETKAASDYLTRFSKLIRKVLINSQRKSISLEEEIEMLRLYMDMERLRFKNSFDFNIIYTNSFDTGNIFIPPMLLQPFCENAIWHGLMHKEGKGKLDIALTMENNILRCVITDNGIGRDKAEQLNSKSIEKDKSFGLKITTDRLAILNQNPSIQTFYEMHDLIDEDGNAAGTKVVIKIDYAEELVEL